MTPSVSILEAPTRTDHDRLQGAWEFVSGRRRAQLIVSGHHCVVKFKSGDIYVGLFELDPARRPKRINVLIREGPERHQGKVSLGIYEFDGDLFRWCPNDPGVEERLTTFPPADDPHYLTLVFRREQD
jgi:uncharacterized protein (TIGR03067 family)